MESTLLRYARDIVQGLDYRHNAVGIAHMDLKPENLLKSADGTVKIADFGVSFIGERKNRAPSAVKRIVGTPAFIAPEMLDETGTIRISLISGRLVSVYSTWPLHIFHLLARQSFR